MGTTQLTILAAGALAAFLLATLLGRLLIPWLHKMRFGQTIRDIGPTWHQKKQGTPTMGGIIFIIGSVAALAGTLIVCQLFFGLRLEAFTLTDHVRLFGGVALALLCAAIGFADDYIKVVKKRNLGLTAPQKMFAQLLVAFCYAFMLYVTGNTLVHIPFVGMVDFGMWHIPFTIFVIAAMTNAVNFTDGIDGLCGSVSFVAVLFFVVAAGICDGVQYTQGLIGSTFAGALAGFLVWNLYPARVIMGDTGSLYIGAMVTALAFGINRPLLLLPVGIVYVAEMLSVVLQVLYFKATGGKRLFKMSPIHHHYEMSGWSEMKIVAVFVIVTLLGCGAAGAFLLFT